MPYINIYIPIIIGGVFVIVGLAMYLWGRRGKKRYDEVLAARTDVKEYIDQWPQRLNYDAFKLGGVISIAVGAVLLGLAGIFSQFD